MARKVTGNLRKELDQYAERVQKLEKNALALAAEDDCAFNEINGHAEKIQILEDHCDYVHDRLDEVINKLEELVHEE